MVAASERLAPSQSRITPEPERGLYESFQIQFVMFTRSALGTPIDPAPVLLSGIHCSTSHGVSVGNAQRGTLHHSKRLKTRLSKHTRAATFEPSKAGLLSL